MVSTEDKLDEILQIVQKIHIENAARVKWEEGIENKVEDHQEIIYGNGKDGLKTTVALLKDRVNGIANWNRIFGTLALAEVLALVFAILTHQMNFP